MRLAWKECKHSSSDHWPAAVGHLSKRPLFGGSVLGNIGFSGSSLRMGFSKPAKFKRGNSFSNLQPGPALEAYFPGSVCRLWG